MYIVPICSSTFSQHYCWFVCEAQISLVGLFFYLPKKKVYWSVHEKNFYSVCANLILLAPTHTVTILQCCKFLRATNMGLNDFKSYLIGLAVLLFTHHLVYVHAFTTPETQNFLNGPPQYHSEAELLDLFAHLAKKYPNLAKVHSLGASVEGRDLAVIQISTNVGHRDLLKPMFKYVANMHGYSIHSNVFKWPATLLNVAKIHTHRHNYETRLGMCVRACVCIFAKSKLKPLQQSTINGFQIKYIIWCSV